jgi:hypothetical protein
VAAAYLLDAIYPFYVAYDPNLPVSQPPEKST